MQAEQKSLAITEAKAIEQLVNQLTQSSNSSITSYSSLVLELKTHFSNISGLVEDLRKSNDEESIRMAQNLEKYQKTFEDTISKKDPLVEAFSSIDKTMDSDGSSKSQDAALPLASQAEQSTTESTDPQQRTIGEDFLSSLLFLIAISIAFALVWARLSE